MLKIYSDAAVSPIDQLAGAGLVITGQDLYEQLSYPLPKTKDNHLAELQAFLIALEWVAENDHTDTYLLFYTDSQLIAQSVKKGRIKNKDYKSIFASILDSLQALYLYEVKWIPDKENKGADNLAKQALAKQRKNKKG